MLNKTIRKPDEGMRQWLVEVPGKPVGKESVRVGEHSARIPGKSIEFMKQVGYEAKIAGVQMVERCFVDTYAILPVTMKKGVECEPLVRPDRDNIEKCVNDGLHKILYTNDKNIIWGETGYFFLDADFEPRTILVITECKWTDFRISKEDLISFLGVQP
jgi:Holliday junction resolvase RusA-like endonuclease